MSMTVYKKINIALLMIAIVVAVASRWYWGVSCLDSAGCSFVMRNAYLRPLIEGGQDLAIIFAALLVFPGNLFKRWLQFIFSWAFPLSALFIGSIDIHRTGIFDFDRGNTARLLAILSFGITVIFIAMYYLVAWWKKRKGGSVVCIKK